MKLVIDDGGRSNYFKADDVGDCVTRAIAIALDEDYKTVYETIKKFLGYSARNGVKKTDTKKLMTHLGFKWCPTMAIGQGCKVHMKADELPGGTIIVKLSSHVCCVKDGVMYDTYDCSRDETRCVYGYWYR